MEDPVVPLERNLYSRLHGKYGVEVRICSLTKTIFTSGSELLMGHTSL